MSVVIGSAVPWSCPGCSIDVAPTQQYCTVCLRARPLPRQGHPQIFSGLRIHFNGIIPRTLKHPSHSIEWRMAERHGASCEVTFDTSSTTILVYRPGYERSDKVRLCVDRYQQIPCVPIAWMLDSLLQSRMIHPVLYRLQSIPAVALPTVRGPVLPHHQHPYFVMNAEEYALGPIPGRGALRSSDGGGLALSSARDEVVKGTMRDLTIPEAIWTNLSVLDAALCARHCATNNGSDGGASTSGATPFDVTGKSGAGTPSQQDDNDDDDEAAYDTAHKGKSASHSSGVELFASLKNEMRVNRDLLGGMRVVLSESLHRDARVAKVIAVAGGEVVGQDALHDGTATHVLYHNDDKKDALMIEACHVASTLNEQLQLATLTWLEDCLLLGELLPIVDMYGPSGKLRQTLQKKREKRGA